MKKIGVITTGGDAPGMNAAIRAAVRTALYYNKEVVGIRRGWSGLIYGEIIDMDSRSVSGILNRGGTILHTVRCPEFKTKEGQKTAVKTIRENNIDGLVVIGGDGSFRAARQLNTKWGVPAIGVPATIDNDIPGTDYSIGFDTAVNTALEAIDRIRDTAFSHERIFVIEVMGRERGFLALEVGIAGGADLVLIPEVKWDFKKIVKNIEEKRKEGKVSLIIVAAEGAYRGEELGRNIEKETGLEVRVSVLGHLQRGGIPTAFSRVLASMFASAAVENLIKGEKNKMVGIVSGKVVVSNLNDVLKHKKSVDLSLYRLTKVLEI